MWSANFYYTGSFRTSGQIEKIYVKEGDFVKAGSPIASLDIQSLKYTAGVGSNTTEQAKANLEKTINTYDTNIKSAEANITSIDSSIEAGETALKAAEDSIASMQQGLTAANKNAEAAQISADTMLSQLEGTRILHDNGIVSDRELESLEAQYAAQNAAVENAKSASASQQANIDKTLADIGVKKAELDDLYIKRQNAVDTLENLKVSKQKDIDSINSQISSAGINEDMTQKNINDSILYADFDCYVISSPYKEGENIGANSPVVTVKGKQNIVTIGVPGKDINKINFDSKVMINKYISGSIDKIAKYPNENTRTYDVDILVEDDSVQAGDTVDIKIGIGSGMRYYVPLTSVFNSEGVDYIYAVDENNRVYKKEVDVLGVDGGNVFISLDMENSSEIIVVTDGIKSINENDLIKYQ